MEQTKTISALSFIADCFFATQFALLFANLLAAELGFGAVLFEGNIAFYGKSGFDYASRFKIRYHDLPDGADSSFFLCRELRAGYLDGITGVYQTPQGYYAAEEHPDEFSAFDAGFPKKEKLVLPGQIF